MVIQRGWFFSHIWSVKHVVGDGLKLETIAMVWRRLWIFVHFLLFFGQLYGGNSSKGGLIGIVVHVTYVSWVGWWWMFVENVFMTPGESRWHPLSVEFDDRHFERRSHHLQNEPWVAQMSMNVALIVRYASKKNIFFSENLCLRMLKVTYIKRAYENRSNPRRLWGRRRLGHTVGCDFEERINAWKHLSGWIPEVCCWAFVC